MPIRNLQLFLLLLASGLASSAHAGAFISGGDLTRLMMPFLDVEESAHGKLVPVFLERRKMVIPLPGLFVFFGPSGCMTAAVEGSRLAVNDGQCFEGEGLADRGAFLAASGYSRAHLEGKPTLVVFSPLFELERLTEAAANRADQLQADRTKLLSILESWQAENAGVAVERVSVRLP